MQKFVRSGIWVWLLTSALAFSACKKSSEYENPVYKCECGSLSWRGQQFDLLDANYVTADPTEPLSRRYYITAKVQVDGEHKAHSVSMTLEVDDATDGVFYPANGDAIVEVTEVNYNDPLLPVRTFLPVNGVINITPAVLGGTEPVQFNLVLKELYNGSLVGFDVPFSGNFKVVVTP